MLPIIPAMVRKHMNHGLMNRWFIALCGTEIFTAISDTWAVHLDLMGPDNVALKYITHTSYLVGRSLITPICIAYLFARIGIWYKYRGNKTFFAGFFALAAIPVFLLLVINPFKHIMFYLAEGDAYTRGPLMIVMYATSVLYGIVGYIVLFRYINLIGFIRIVYLLVILSITAVATAIQFLFPSIIIENFAMAIVCLIMFLGIQSPEDRLYGRTAFLKISAFSDDLKMIKEMATDAGLVIISITNYDTLLNMLGYDMMLESLKKMSDMADSIRSEFDSEMEFYYLGHGIFVITLITGDAYEVDEVASRMNRLMLEDMEVGAVNVRFNANLCAAMFPGDIINPADIIPFAEDLKKADYTGDIRYAKDEFDRRHYEIRRNISEVIDRAISNGNLKMVYQPIYSVENERYVALEAFLRLEDPNFGSISPELFIKEAERCGEIHGITTYLFEQICDFVSKPEFMQLNLKWIEINMSPVQCMWTDLVSVLISLMDSYNVNPDNICLNIVDKDNDKYLDRMYSNLEKLSEYGVHVYMDDFGAGVFEIERINNLPLDGIKLDREFIRTSIESDSMLVLENSVRMIKDMGLEAAAVGVESLFVRRRLVEMGCDIQQGYYYSAPKEKGDLIRFIMGLPGVLV